MEPIPIPTMPRPAIKIVFRSTAATMVAVWRGCQGLKVRDIVWVPATGRTGRGKSWGSISCIRLIISANTVAPDMIGREIQFELISDKW